MAEIVWYPGHMAKAKRLIKEALPNIDMVIELLDARAPISSTNPDFKSLFGNKPTLTLLTKCSLADKNETKRFESALKSSGREVIAIDCKTGQGIKSIQNGIKSLMSEKLARDAARGIKRPIRAMVAGITNVGKSTLINTISGTKKAVAQDRPGVTRHNSRISVPSLGLELTDTPGILWHKFDDELVGVKLACLGSIKDDILDTLELSCRLIGLIRENYSECLVNRFGIVLQDEDSDYDVFEKIARRRGFLRSGGVIDEDRAAGVILDEFRAGKIGLITLDRV
ncbi:MAG: ribosome biogenesis GTPase YlqF [Clostridia bacterium]|nr:ribosome biogenesis GTPase YlqF [Clostridia bacterium]